MINKLAQFMIFSALTLLLISCSQIEKLNIDSLKQEGSSNQFNENLDGNVIKARVSRVSDGDTIIVNSIEPINIDESILTEINQIITSEGEISVRFLALDTPEITKGKNELYGQEAKELVEYMLSNGEVILEIDEKALFDHYDRLLAHIFTLEGESVQLALLETGLARVAYLFDDYKYVSKYKQAEKRAKEQRLNVHSIEGYVSDRGFNMDVIDDNVNMQGVNFDEIVHYLKEVLRNSIKYTVIMVK